MVCKAAGTNKFSSVLNPFLPIPKKREENKGRDAEFLPLPAEI